MGGVLSFLGVPLTKYLPYCSSVSLFISELPDKGSVKGAGETEYGRGNRRQVCRQKTLGETGDGRRDRQRSGRQDGRGDRTVGETGDGQLQTAHYTFKSLQNLIKSWELATLGWISEIPRENVYCSLHNRRSDGAAVGLKGQSS